MKYKGLTYSYTVYAFTFFLAPLLLILFYSLTAAGGDGSVTFTLENFARFFHSKGGIEGLTCRLKKLYKMH